MATRYSAAVNRIVGVCRRPLNTSDLLADLRASFVCERPVGVEEAGISDREGDPRFRTNPSAPSRDAVGSRRGRHVATCAPRVGPARAEDWLRAVHSVGRTRGVCRQLGWGRPTWRTDCTQEGPRADSIFVFTPTFICPSCSKGPSTWLFRNRTFLRPLSKVTSQENLSWHTIEIIGLKRIRSRKR